MREVVNAASWLDERRSDVGAIIITGEGKSFAAGADVKELANVTAEEVCKLCSLQANSIAPLKAHRSRPEMTVFYVFNHSSGNVMLI